MMPWDVYPAIDLRGGQVVRLRQGRADRQTTYDSDPMAIAQRWRDSGAQWLHVVNLDAAFAQPDSANRSALTRILTVGPMVQFGGGLRTLESIESALDLGVRRVVIGTAAIQDPAIVGAAVSMFGAEHIAVGLDVRDRVVQTHGWTQAAADSALALALRWARAGLCWLTITDVRRDGTGKGINLALFTELAQASNLNVIASGGVASLEDVRAARHAGLAGIIVGRALYEGQIDLHQAIQINSRTEVPSAR